MKVFLTDGTADGFYTAVFYAYREGDALITSQKDLQLTFDSTLINVTAEADKSARVQRRLNSFDAYATGDIDLALRSNLKTKEQTAFEYLKLIVKHGHAVRKMFSLAAVTEMSELTGKVTTEIHRMKGFIRFKVTAGGTMYAPYSPDNDITDLLVPHFKARLGKLPFVIHDVRRGKAALCDGRHWIMTEAGSAEIELAEDERAFEALWQKYYRSINIKERPHEKQMKGYMPVRYWKFLPEKSDHDGQ